MKLQRKFSDCRHIDADLQVPVGIGPRRKASGEEIGAAALSKFNEALVSCRRVTAGVRLSGMDAGTLHL
jgi:hypothetical protein